jgi:phytoene synthase
MAEAEILPEVDSQAAKAHVRRVVEASATSFLWGMRILPEERRDGMFAIYAYCREVDDIADEEAPLDQKLAHLAEWRREIDRLYAGAPRKPTAQALVEPVRKFALPRQEFIALIEGMEMDVKTTMRGPTWAELLAYCRRVAGAVGMLSIRVFGAREREAEDLAVTLGEALQLTNILRDLAEDAERGRLYLPRELLDKFGVDYSDAAGALKDPGLGKAASELAKVARNRFDRSRALIARCDRRPLKPAILMMEIYDRILQRLEARGWARPAEPVKLPKLEKLWIALRHGML